MSPQATSCPACKRLKDLKSTKVVNLLELVLYDLGSGMVFFFAIVIVAECPVIPTPTLLVECILLVVIPDDATLRLLLCAETILYDFWLHVDEHCIWSETVCFLAISLEICLDHSLPYQLTAIFDFFEEGLEEGRAKLVPALAHLDCNDRH